MKWYFLLEIFLVSNIIVYFIGYCKGYRECHEYKNYGGDMHRS